MYVDDVWLFLEENGLVFGKIKLSSMEIGNFFWFEILYYFNYLYYWCCLNLGMYSSIVPTLVYVFFL